MGSGPIEVGNGTQRNELAVADSAVSDLFASAVKDAHESPLADRMRPQSLDEVVGQDHIVGPGRLLRRAIQADRLSSILLCGPPGTGKTSLARVIANTSRSQFESLNAVLAGVKDIREAIDRADERLRLYAKRTILFVDEVHRWNKAQQDALLPWVENGTVILVGATTENPFFEVNKALVSRSRVFQLKSLDSKALLLTAQRAILNTERGYGKWQVDFEDGALEHIIDIANGDARSLLNALELAIETTVDHWPPPEGERIRVSLYAAEESIQRKAVLYDRDGDYHFDTISAFIKSIRGSDPDASLYWLAKMVRAGEDPAFIFRRMIISAGEDVGLADPNAIVVVQACATAFERIGFPEGNFQLAQAALYLATAPKSNTTLAFFDAMAEIEKEEAEVPNHLRDDHRDKEGFGHGDGYIYPHAYREHWAAQQYLPKALAGRTFYTPSIVGYEGRLRDEVLRKREIQAAIVLSEDDTDGQILSYSASSKGREGWHKRLESGRGELLLGQRNAIFEKAKPSRHHRILVADADDGLLLWEAVRRSPEGLAAGLLRSDTSSDALLRYAQSLDEIERPALLVSKNGALPSPELAAEKLGTPLFDIIIARESWRKAGLDQSPKKHFEKIATEARELLAVEGRIVLLESPPLLGERISRHLQKAELSESLLQDLQAAESAFFEGEATRWNWDADDIQAAFTSAGFLVEIEILDQAEERPIGNKEILAWFDSEQSTWGKHVSEKLGKEAFESLRSAFVVLCSKGPLLWKWKSLLVHSRPERGG